MMKLKYINGYGELVKVPVKSAEEAQKIVSENSIENVEMYNIEIEFDEEPKEKYEAPKVEFISFDQLYRITELTIPMRASEIENIPDHLKGQMLCPYCWEALYNTKKGKYHNYCPGCGRKVANNVD